MGAGKAIRHALMEKNITITALCEEMGVPRQTMANKLSQDKLTVSSTLKIAEHINCELVLRDRDTGQEYLIRP